MILDNLRKLELVEEYRRIQENAYQMSLLELAGWAKEKFQLQKLSSKPTMSRIIRNGAKIREEINNKKFKAESDRTMKFPELEKL